MECEISVSARLHRDFPELRFSPSVGRVTDPGTRTNQEMDPMRWILSLVGVLAFLVADVAAQEPTEKPNTDPQDGIERPRGQREAGARRRAARMNQDRQDDVRAERRSPRRATQGQRRLPDRARAMQGRRSIPDRARGMQRTRDGRCGAAPRAEGRGRGAQQGEKQRFQPRGQRRGGTTQKCEKCGCDGSCKVNQARGNQRGTPRAEGNRGRGGRTAAPEGRRGRNATRSGRRPL